MPLEIRTARSDDVRTFASWRYESPYDVYDMTDDLEDTVDYFLDAGLRCHVLVDGTELAGFCTFGRDGQVPGGTYRTNAVDIGLGIRPDLTGRGRGREYVGVVVAKAGQLFPGLPLRVTIAAWNTRALRTWLNAGFAHASRFTIHGTSGDTEYVILERGPVPGST